MYPKKSGPIERIDQVMNNETRVLGRGCIYATRGRRVDAITDIGCEIWDMSRQRSNLKREVRCRARRWNVSNGGRERMRETAFLVASVLVLLIGAPEQAFQAVDLIDCPTSGLPPWGSYQLNLRLQPDGGMIGGVGAGLFDRLLLRVAYGGNGVIGYGSPTPDPRPELEVRLRILGEGYLSPALSLGFSSRGYDGYDSDNGRYRIKSKGLYGVASKSLFHLERLDLHLGGNYSLEGTDKDPDLFLGIEQYLNPDFSLLGELSLGLNDDEEGIGEGKGYLNLGLRWVFGGRLAMEFSFRNLTDNGEEGMNRTGKITYIDYF